MEKPQVNKIYWYLDELQTLNGFVQRATQDKIMHFAKKDIGIMINEIGNLPPGTMIEISYKLA